MTRPATIQPPRPGGGLGSLGAVTILLLGAVHSVEAQEVDECVQQVSRNMDVVDEAVAFLLQGRVTTRPHTFVEDGCIGVLAFGAQGARQLGLSLHAAGGMELANAGTPRRFAYARYCGRQGVTIHWSLRMRGGRGEVKVLLVDDAPRVVEVPQACAGPNPGLRTARPELGRVPPGRTADERLRSVADELTRRGYRQLTRPAEPLPFVLPVDDEACFLAVATADDAGHGALIEVHGPEGVIGRDRVPARRDARVRLCISMSGHFEIHARPLRQGGQVRVGVFRLQPPEFPEHVTGRAKVYYAELAARLAARGFRLQPESWTHLRAGEQLVRPMHLEEGCHVLAAAPAAESVGDEIELELRSAEGNPIARQTMGTSTPYLFHCTTAEELVELVVQTAGEGRVLILRGQS